MLAIVGIVVVFGAVITGYVLHHGNIMVLYQPTEFIIIGGAALGSLIIMSSPKLMKDILKSFPGMLKGNKMNKKKYLEVLGLLYIIFSKIRKEGVLTIETEIEKPKESKLFGEYPVVAKDHHLLDFICDNLRVFVIGIKPMELEDMMDTEIAAHHEESALPSEMLNKMSDSLPGFGIVAAVLGVVITMGKMSQGPEAIGASVAAALVGTFLGILLCYGLFGPIATNMEQIVHNNGKIFEVVKVALVSFSNDMPPQMAVEAARRVLSSDVRPSFLELEDAVRQKKKG